MKSIRTLSNNDDLTNFLLPIIGKNAERVTFRLKAYRIEKKTHLIGLAQRKLPKESARTAQRKGLSRSYLDVQRKIQAELVISQFQKAMEVSRNDAIKIYNKCIRATSNFQRYNYGTGCAFGAIKEKKAVHFTESFWFQAPRIRVEQDFFVVPHYTDTGMVFDQGERGTCVANALCSAINYATRWMSSRQFMYHQAKMTDGVATEEGTYIETAVKVLTEGKIVDVGNVEESVWPYNPYAGKTTHQGPPPEKSFNTKRVFSCVKPVFVRNNAKIDDIKYLLNYNRDGKSSLVVIGVAIHESFFSYNTSDTGWVTMPLPGEAVIGYHAMAICGYDEARRLFLVRNSWGPHWAHNNDRGYAGHAWIPYEYIKKYCHVAVSLYDFKEEHIIVPEEERLYNKRTIKTYAGRMAAISKERQEPVRRVKNHSSPLRLLVKIAALLILGYTYKDPLIRAKDILKEVIEERLNINGLKNKVSEFFEDHTN